MATIDLGKIKLVNHGTWDSSTTYTADDIVQHTDSGILSTYICVVASSQGHTPSTSGTLHASWQFLAKGVTDNIPVQTGHSGKFLTTNGTALSFASVEAFVSGMILIWSGAANAIPTGWVLCDGTNSTPNLSGKFILGYGSGHAKAGTMNNNDEPKIVETTHLPPIVHSDGDSDKPRVDHAASSGITSYTLAYSSNYDGNRAKIHYLLQ